MALDALTLARYGIDYNMGLTRCMNDASFYERFLTMFLKDDSFQRAKAAYERGELDTVFKCAHELKGVCGNAALKELYDAVSPLVELLRHGQASEAQVRQLFDAMEAAYDRAVKGIELAKS